MRNRALLFLPVVLAQLAVPAWMIHRHERVLHEGTAYKFRTAPIDPTDPFRGEYVMLDFAAEQGSWNCPAVDMDGERREVFATLGTDSLGFATITALGTTEPAEPHLTVEVVPYEVDSLHNVDRVSLPFDRYYLPEGQGAHAEDLMSPQWTEDHREDPKEAYAVVRVYEGEAVIEDLIIGGRPLRAWMEQ